MRRREFIAGVGGAAACWPLAASAQAPLKPHRIAFVHSGIPANKLTETTGPFWVRRFYETLRGLGDVEGGNLVVERFSAEGLSDRFAALSAEIVSRKPEVIVANHNDLIRALIAATSTIPVVAITGDPVATGLVTNLAHPGGNLTGVSIDTGPEIFGKRLQILKEAVPSVTKVAYPISIGVTWDGSRGISFRDAAQHLGIVLTGLDIPNVDEARLRRSFAEMKEQQFDAVVIDDSGSFLALRALIAELAERYRLPVIYPYRDYVEQGGLIAFAPDLGELAVRMATDVHQILDGAKAGDIPIYQPSKFLMIINLKTAKAMGLELPATLIARADEVIE